MQSFEATEKFFGFFQKNNTKPDSDGTNVLNYKYERITNRDYAATKFLQL